MTHLMNNNTCTDSADMTPNIDQELIVVEAVEINNIQSLHEQIDNWNIYCVCDSRETANNIIQKDMKTGDILRGRITGTFTLQTKESI